MSSHPNSSFLNSCVKVPIDPCNRCPAPTFGRPLIYYGQDKMCTKKKKKCKKKLEELESEKKTKEALQKLTSFYHSIPDYAEINHLPKDEFYSTLNKLKNACEKLAIGNIESESTPSPSVDSFKSKKKSTKKKRKKRISVDKVDENIIENPPLRFNTYKAFREHIVEKQCQQICDSRPTPKKEEMQFKSYKDFREHIDQKPCLVNSYISEDDVGDHFPSFREKSSHPKIYFDQETDMNSCGEDCKYNKTDYFKCNNSNFTVKFDDSNKNALKLHKKPYDTYKSFREDVDKLFENELNLIELEKCNELSSKHEVGKPKTPKINIEQKDDVLSVFQEDIPEEPINMINEAEIIRKYNKYFENTKESPKIEQKKSLSVNDLREDIESKLSLKEPSTDCNQKEVLQRSKDTSCHIEKEKSKVTVNFSPTNVKKPETISPFAILLPKKKKRPISASPVYPVARPNLAATLRKEISKKKLEELDNHCTFRDTNTPQVDWEVRKTPAWKSLSLSESHKNVLQIRLATRKAEQRRQESEYELQMLLMKQRVKSAPLLLEGPTHWGPHVGKLSHSCHKDNFVHQCPKTRLKKRRPGSAYSKQRAMMPLPPHTRKSISRCSANSTNLNDSDDLCSLDRAYL